MIRASPAPVDCGPRGRMCGCPSGAADAHSSLPRGTSPSASTALAHQCQRRPAFHVGHALSCVGSGDGVLDTIRDASCPRRRWCWRPPRHARARVDAMGSHEGRAVLSAERLARSPGHVNRRSTDRVRRVAHLGSVAGWRGRDVSDRSPWLPRIARRGGRRAWLLRDVLARCQAPIVASIDV
jgi:hypothetical protein